MIQVRSIFQFNLQTLKTMAKNTQKSLLKLFLIALILWLITIIMFHKSALYGGDSDTLKHIDIQHEIEDSNFDDFMYYKNDEDYELFEKNHSPNAAPLQPPNPHNALGEMGKPVIINIDKLSRQEKFKYRHAMKIHGLNSYLSDLISLRRSLPDFRDEKCKEIGRYPEDLPATSVIISFHDESWSTLLRSVHSILDRTPEHLLSEIILVDDNSETENLKRPLEEYLSSYPKVKIIRTSKREGLVRARIIGAKAAIGQVLTFMDSHIECTEGWLQPLVAKIREDPKVAVAPVIEKIEQETFEVKGTKCQDVSVGGFDWGLIFEWHAIPRKVAESLSHPCDPIPSPTMAGTIFSISKDYFERLGYYDNQLDIWGGENLELSFKVWMCGGKVFQIPCSHVGHIYRSINPYCKKTMAKFGNFVRKNSLRITQVWLDDYAYIYYALNEKSTSPEQVGDLSEAIAKRKELGCRSFDWYLTNVYPEFFIRSKSPAFGQIRNMGKFSPTVCLDTPRYNLYRPVEIFECKEGEKGQLWGLTHLGEIRNDVGCFDYIDSRAIIMHCHGKEGTQLWIYKMQTKQIYHKTTGKCLAVNNWDSKYYLLTLADCTPPNGLNQWIVTNMNETALKLVENSLM